MLCCHSDASSSYIMCTLAFLAVICVFLQTSVDGSISRESSVASNQFSLNLLKNILQERSGNAVASPAGVYTLLGVLQQASGGKSQLQINSALNTAPQHTRYICRNITSKYRSYHERQVLLEFENRVFINDSFQLQPDFNLTLSEDFDAGVDVVDFTASANASDVINTWVASSTHNRITKLFQPNDLPPQTVLAMVNVIYFQNHWLHPFYSTVDGNFSSSPDNQSTVPTLRHVFNYHSGENSELGAKFVHLDFAHTVDFTVMLVLPSERHGLDSVVERLTAETLTSLVSHVGYKRVTLSVPVFRLTSDLDLISTLRKLGVSDVFDDVANLTGIAAAPLFVGKFVQKAEIKLDEGGVTAAAATGFTVQMRSGRGHHNVTEELHFIADQPFLFFVVDRAHRVPLFAGRVNHPTSST